MPGPNCAGALHKPKPQECEPLAFSPAQEAARLMLEGPARYCCLAGGTRSGKTFLIVRAIVNRAVHTPESRHALLRFHANAARASLAKDTLPHVMKLCFPHVALKEHKQEGTFAMSNGASLVIGGLDDDERVEKILGTEYASVFLNEASQIPYDSALIAFTRLAQKTAARQRAYVDLNPTSKTHWTNVLFGDKRDPISRQPLPQPELYGRAFLNPRDNSANLTEEFLASLAALPERKRQRFYEGLYTEDVDDALWSFETIDKGRRPAPPEEERKVVAIGVDPSGADGLKQGDATGIVVATIGFDGDAYVLADRTTQDKPEVWAQRVVEAYHTFKADVIVVETNFGGDMARATLHAVDRTLNITTVNASRGKAVRAAPISVAYAQGQVHHAERFDKLEEQFCAFTIGGYHGAGSPDNADAAIWALTHLFTLPGMPGILGYYGNEVTG